MEARINDLTLSYQDTGSSTAAPLVFVHGFPFDHTMWDAQVELFKPRFRVITYDLRGHGKSGAGDGQYSLEFFVDDFFGLLDHLGLKSVIVCGLSMGGYVVLRAMERDPQRFRALVLCDTRSEADSNETKIKRSASIKVIKKKGVSSFSEGFLKAIFSPDSFARIPKAIDQIRRTIEATPVVGLCGSLLAMAGRTDTTSLLPKITIPTLILVGEEDAVTPPTAAQAMNTLIPGSKLFTIPQAGHMSNLENPVAFNKHLSEFLLPLAKV